MTRKLLFIPIAVFALLIGLYPLMYAFVEKEYTFLNSKFPELLSDYFWMTFFYLHIVFGGLSLFIGWIQFLPKIRIQRPKIHRTVGKVYILSVFFSSISAIYLGFFANEGIISSVGFISLGIVWLASTLLAFYEIKRWRINEHQKWMIISYAACFSAVTLRIYMPILNNFLEPGTTYKTVAWLCWVPNIIVAYVITKRLKL